MTHLRIEQNENAYNLSAREQVSSALIKKLYDIVTDPNNVFDEFSHLKGFLHVNEGGTYQEYIDALTDDTNNLTKDMDITAAKIYLQCDPELIRLFALDGIGDGIGVSQNDLLYITNISGNKYKNNTSIVDASILKKCIMLTNLDQSAFYGCTSLQQVSLPNSLTSLSDPGSTDSAYHGVFRDCTSLVQVELGTGISAIGNRCFMGCSALQTITIPANITSFTGYGTFASCTSLETITINASSITISGGMFNNCSKLQFDSFNKISSFPEECFMNAGTDSSVNWGDVVVEEQNTTWGGIGNRFKGCRMETFTMNSSTLTKIWDEQDRGWIWGGFNFCENPILTKIDLTGCTALTEISFGLVRTCDSLTTIKLPASLTTIGNYLCANCSNLTYVVLYSTTPPTVGNTTNIFLNSTSHLTVYVPDGSVSAYQNDASWSQFTIASINSLPSGV